MSKKTNAVLRVVPLMLALAVAGSAEAVIKKKGLTMTKNQIYAGGKIGITVPISIGRAADDVSFRDVAANGFAAMAEGLWMMTDYVGVGCELSYATNPYKEQFWAALNYRGSFDASYSDYGFGLMGKAIMGKRKVKPYIGASVVAHYLYNTLDFQMDEAYAGTVEDESVSYTYKKLHAGGAIEAGVYCKAAENVYVTISVRFNIVPSVKEKTLTTVDPYSFIEKTVVVNPHGNQNNLTFTAGLHFGTRKSKRK